MFIALYVWDQNGFIESHCFFWGNCIKIQLFRDPGICLGEWIWRIILFFFGNFISKSGIHRHHCWRPVSKNSLHCVDHNCIHL